MNRQRIVVLGSTGQLGTDLVEVLRLDDKGETVPVSHAACDCTNANEVGEMLRKLHPDVVINCAAYVRVDDCEDHAREAFAVNAIGALNVARACAAVEALCVYISTDYVFDGSKGSPYVESDPTCPINVYGASKVAGEHLVQQAAPHSLIVRTSSLFGKTGARGKGGNFVETIVAKAKAALPRWRILSHLCHRKLRLWRCAETVPPDDSESLPEASVLLQYWLSRMVRHREYFGPHVTRRQN